MAALCVLHELLVACKSRQLSSRGSIATQETQRILEPIAGTKATSNSEAVYGEVERLSAAPRRSTG